MIRSKQFSVCCTVCIDISCVSKRNFIVIQNKLLIKAFGIEVSVIKNYVTKLNEWALHYLYSLLVTACVHTKKKEDVFGISNCRNVSPLPEHNLTGIFYFDKVFLF